MKQTEIKLKPVKDQVIVITGASSGIGLMTAKLGAKAGARIMISSRNTDALEQVCNEIKRDGGQVEFVTADVSKYEDMERLKDETLKVFGRIDTWVNNAGKSVFGSLLDVPLEEERDLFETNFWGVRHGCRVAIPVLAKQGGAVINLGSEVSSVAVPVQGIYSATKHAVKAYTDALRIEIEEKNLPVSVTLIRPAAINTPFTEHASNWLKKGAPSLPPPIYDVEIVAKAILKCAEHPQRDAYIGSVSRLFGVMETLAPSLTDRLLKRMIQKQAEGRPLEHPTENESVLQVPKREGKVRGKHHRKVAKSSTYTRMTTGQKQI